MKPIRARGRTAALTWLTPFVADIIALTCPCGGQVQLHHGKRSQLGRYHAFCPPCGLSNPHTYHTLREAIPGAWAFFQPHAVRDVPRRPRVLPRLHARNGNSLGDRP